jgi:hypothetical protein
LGRLAFGAFATALLSATRLRAMARILIGW